MKNKLPLVLFIITLLFGLISCMKPVEPDADIKDELSQAQSNFEKGLDILVDQTASPVESFQQSIKSYKIILSKGYMNDQIYFNIGNCYRFIRNDALALYYYKKALFQRDKRLYRDAIMAIQIKNGFISDKQWVYHVQDELSHITLLTTFKIKMIISLIWGILFLFLIILNQIYPLKTKLPIFLSLILIPLFITISFSVTQELMDHSKARGVIISDVMAKSGDSYAYEDAFSSTLYTAQSFKLLETRKGWYYIEINKGLRCWIPEPSALIIGNLNP